MKIIKILTVVVIVVASGLMSYYAYLGGFSKVVVAQKTFPSTEIIFTTQVGPYENLAESWEQFASDFASAGLKSCDAYGVYLDPPNTPPEKLRSILACAIDGLSDDLKIALKEKFPSFVLPEAQSYSSSFPYKNEFSFWIGPTKVYPEFQNLIATNAITPSVAIEAYGVDEGRDKILFYMPAKMDLDNYQPLIDAF